MKKHLLFIFFIYLPIVAFAFSGKHHVKDMKRIFPFADCEANEDVLEFYSLVNKYIDSPNDRNTAKPTPIADHPKFSKMKFGNHRIWYHWGFNKNPRNFAPLVQAVEKNINNGVISECDAEDFWQCLITDVKKRNRQLMNHAAQIFGYESLGSISQRQRKQLNAFVAILYSIHLLGDHQTTITDVMSNVQGVYGDVYNAIDDLAGSSRTNIRRARRLKKELRRLQSDPAVFLDKMEDEFTLFLLQLSGPLYNYQKKFENLGYKLKQL